MSKQQMVSLASLNFDSEIPDSQLYQDLRKLGIPEEFCRAFGRYDIQNGYAYQSLARQIASTIDRTAAELRLDSYLDDDKQDENRERDVVTGGLLGATLSQPQVQMVGPGTAPPPPADPQAVPFLRIFTILPAQVGTIAVGMPIGLNPLGLAQIADANNYIGPATAVNGNLVTVTLVGPVQAGLTGLQPGQVYYIQSPGDPLQLWLYADLTAPNVARARYIAISPTEGIIVNWAPFVVSP